MIGKVLRGRNVRHLLYYLYGPGLANEHADPHLLAGFGDPGDLEPERRPGGTWDFRRLAGLLEQPLAALAGPGYDKPVWHCAVRYQLRSIICAINAAFDMAAGYWHNLRSDPVAAR